ncbi:MAG: hypothetical protein JNM69_16910 [Archangium sp.]|nr:hypothetical protein [Archangium sp.]
MLLVSCSKPVTLAPVDAGHRLTADAWLAETLGPVVLGRTSTSELIRQLGRPSRSWDHGGGLEWFLYAGRPPLERRFSAQNGVVTLVHLERSSGGNSPFSPAAALELLSDWKPRDVSVSLYEGRVQARFIGACGLPQLPDHGVQFLFLDGQLSEASISPWRQWEFADQVCPPGKSAGN